VIKHVMKSAAVAYFYCSKSQAEPERANAEAILGCILKQLSQELSDGRIQEPIVMKYNEKLEVAKERKREILPLTVDECVDLIIAVLGQRPITIVINALDECDPVQQSQLVDALRKIAQDGKSSNGTRLAKWFVTSRNEGDILRRLDIFPSYAINSHDTENDLKSFI